MASEPISRPDPEGNGSYISGLFMMAIERGREQRQLKATVINDFLRVQDLLGLVCACGSRVPLKIFTVAEAERCYELARSGKRGELREKIDEQLGEYIAVCPRCRYRGLLPLRLPGMASVLAPDGETSEMRATGS
jgi:DNA-directed RNA polymerase subunit RPC12/RpoP